MLLLHHLPTSLGFCRRDHMPVSPEAVVLDLQMAACRWHAKVTMCLSSVMGLGLHSIKSKLALSISLSHTQTETKRDKKLISRRTAFRKGLSATILLLMKVKLRLLNTPHAATCGNPWTQGEVSNSWGLQGTWTLECGWDSSRHYTHWSCSL